MAVHQTLPFAMNLNFAKERRMAASPNLDPSSLVTKCPRSDTNSTKGQNIGGIVPVRVCFTSEATPWRWSSFLSLFTEGVVAMQPDAFLVIFFSACCKFLLFPSYPLVPHSPTSLRTCPIRLCHRRQRDSTDRFAHRRRVPLAKMMA